jgi:hypothetical protein
LSDERVAADADGPIPMSQLLATLREIANDEERMFKVYGHWSRKHRARCLDIAANFILGELIEQKQYRRGR